TVERTFITASSPLNTSKSTRGFTPPSFTESCASTYRLICSCVARCTGSGSDTIPAAYFSTSSRLGAYIRAATRSSPVREISRARIPPVRDLRIECGVTRTYESSSAIDKKRPRGPPENANFKPFFGQNPRRPGNFENIFVRAAKLRAARGDRQRIFARE